MDSLFGAVSVGFFLLLVGLLFVTVPGLYKDIITFTQDFKGTLVPHMQVNITAPRYSGIHLTSYSTVYSAAEQFSLVWAVFLSALLVARIVLGARLRRKAQNLGDVVFWFGTAYLIQTLLINPINNPINTGSDLVKYWFEFWPAIIILIGISLIARATFLAVARRS